MDYLNLLGANAEEVKTSAAGRSVVVAPTHVASAVSGQAHDVVSVAGYPTGRHHGLIKASEARLAVYTGASEVWVAVDPNLGDCNDILAELVAVREACPPPVRLGLIATNQASIDAAELAGFQRIILHHGQQADSALPTVDFDFSEPA